METPDKVKMEINIAGERIFLTVPVSQQELVRKTERSVAQLYTKWRRDFPDKTTGELLAMMAYQYASYYDQLLNRLDDAKISADDLARRLDTLLEQNGSI